jgi:hypothetical protein
MLMHDADLKSSCIGGGAEFDQGASRAIVLPKSVLMNSDESVMVTSTSKIKFNTWL